MQFHELSGDDPISPRKLGAAARYQFLGALCYRLAGNDERARNVCRQGALLATEIREFEPDFLEPAPEAPSGFCHETIGDFRLLGKFGSFEDAYDEASRSYEKVPNPRQWAAEPEFELLMDTLIELAEGVDYDLPADLAGQARHVSLTARIELKRTELPTLLERLMTAGGWTDVSR